MKVSVIGLEFIVVCLVGLLLSFPPKSFAQTFSSTGNMTTDVGATSATLLNNGEVLVAGGSTDGSPSAIAELFNSSTGTFSATGSLKEARYGHTATLLPTGMVLVAGGENPGYLAESELYNPTSGTFAATGSLHTARAYHTATSLSNGTVLIVGGYGGTAGYLASAELFNPSTGTFTVTGSLHTARYYHTATLLNNGMVLIAGGTGSSGALSSAELYNPSTGTFTVTGSMHSPRFSTTATLLPGGTVLVAGGESSVYPATVLSSAEIYNPTAGTFTLTGSLNTGRADHTATLLTNSVVLLAGGFASNGPTATAELYSVSSGTFAYTGPEEISEGYGPATLLTNGKVLVVSIGGNGEYCCNGAELYTFGEMGYVDPKFVVLGVIYAPPGPSTNNFVSYTDSTLIGTTNSVSQSFMEGFMETVTISSGVNIPLVGNGKITNTNSTTSNETTKSTTTVTVNYQDMGTAKTFGTGSYFAPVDNDYDMISVWLNPVLIFTVTSNTVTSNGYGIDQTDEAGMDVIDIPLGYLNGHFGAIPPDIQTRINRSWAADQVFPANQGPALTSSDLAQIAAADPFSVSTYGANFIGSDPPTPQTADFRFTASTCMPPPPASGSPIFNYVQAAPSQAPGIYSCTLMYSNTSTQAQDITTSYSQIFSYDASFSGSGFLSDFTYDLKDSTTLSWTTEAQFGITSTTSSTSALSIQGPPCNNTVPEMGPCVPVYDSGGNQPTQYFIYQDNMFGSFMYAPIHYY